jgi:hypothetical protein
MDVEMAPIEPVADIQPMADDSKPVEEPDQAPAPEGKINAV